MTLLGATRVLLTDGRELVAYRPESPVTQHEYASYRTHDGLQVVAALLPDEPLPQLLVSLSYPTAYPSARDVELIRDAFFGQCRPVNETRMDIGLVNTPYSIHLWGTDESARRKQDGPDR